MWLLGVKTKQLMYRFIVTDDGPCCRFVFVPTSITATTGAPRYGRHLQRFANIYRHQGRNFLFQYSMGFFLNNEITADVSYH